jgi:hypothetical protein
MDGRFEAYEVALELAAALGPVITAVAQRDSSLSSQRIESTSTASPPAAPRKYERPWPWCEPGPSRRRPDWPQQRRSRKSSIEDF